MLLINWSINIIHIKFLCCCSSNANNRQASDWSKIKDLCTLLWHGISVVDSDGLWFICWWIDYLGRLCKGGKSTVTNCYVAGNVFPTVRALVGYFKVTWHLIMKLFPTKISERATLQNLRCQRVTVHCYLLMLTDDQRFTEV